MKIDRTFLFTFALLTTVGLLSSCVPLAVGAVGGYMIADDGIRLQSPVTREKKEEYYEY